MMWTLVTGAALAVPAALLGGRWAAYRNRVRGARLHLESKTGSAIFSEELIAGLPAPAQRYFRHAIQPGAVLATQARLKLRSCVKVRKTDPDAPFRTYRISQILTAGHGIWGSGWTEGRAIPRSVSFWYTRDGAAGRDAILDLYTVRRNAGPVYSKLLKSRYLYELTLLPSALLPQRGAIWQALDDERTQVVVSLDGETMTLELRIGPNGRLLEVTAERWGSVGNPGATFSYIPFGMVVDEEQTFGGYTIPTRLRGGWWYRTDRYVESTLTIVDDAALK